MLAKPIVHPSPLWRAPMLKILQSNDRETDLMRLSDLAKQHGLKYRRVGRTYIFEEYTAHGLRQALGFAEGFDRAKWQVQKL